MGDDDAVDSATASPAAARRSRRLQEDRGAMARAARARYERDPRQIQIREILRAQRERREQNEMLCRAKFVAEPAIAYRKRRALPHIAESFARMLAGDQADTLTSLGLAMEHTPRSPRSPRSLASVRLPQLHQPGPPSSQRQDPPGLAAGSSPAAAPATC